MPIKIAKKGRLYGEGWDCEFHFTRTEAWRAAQRLEQQYGGNVYIEKPLPGTKSWFVWFKR